MHRRILLPDEPGKYRFAAVQIYADGKEVSWSELVEGAAHPATSVVVERQYEVANLALLVSPLALLVLLIPALKRFKKHRKSQANSTVAVARS